LLGLSALTLNPLSGIRGSSIKLIESLEELDDVQKVWANFDIDIEAMVRE